MRKRKKRLRYSLRSFFIVIALTAVFLAFVVRPVVVQRQTVGIIRELGGTVKYVESNRYGLPDWVKKSVGVDYFQSVNTVDFSQTTVRNEHLHVLARLPYLRVLYLNYTHITDDALLTLRELRGLERVSLGSTQVSGQGLIHLAGHPGISHLNLYDSDIRDSTLVALQELPNLTTLNVSLTHITDSACQFFEPLTGLKELNVRGTDISDQRVVELKATLPQCRIVR